MPPSRILCCSRLASSTVIVSPSATPTTVPVRVSADAPMLTMSAIKNPSFLMRIPALLLTTTPKHSAPKNLWSYHS